MTSRRKHSPPASTATSIQRCRRAASVRQEIVCLHRAIFRRNQARINASVLGYTPAFKRYEREYARGLLRYERRASFDELARAIAGADVVYVGDYHTLTQAQRSFLRLVRRLPPERPAVIALELVAARDQALLDAVLAGSETDTTLLRVIAKDAEWAAAGWENIRAIFDLARARGYRVVGIDTRGRGGAGATLEARDRTAARIIARELSLRPGAVVMVLVGELHIAPSHLPARVASALEHGQSRGKVHREPECTPLGRPLVIYQNNEQIYWQLQKRGLENVVELVRIRDREYCLNNTPPIVCQQSFLNWLEADEGSADLEAPEESFKEYARVIAGFFDLPLGEALDEVEVATVADLSFLTRLRRRGDFTAADMREIKKQILCSESYTIPRARMVYLGKLSVNHASEEATHFVRHVCAPSLEPKQLVDAFYARCIEEALGFAGSKVINHKRKCLHTAELTRMLRSRTTQPFERELARLALLHVRMERGERIRGLSRIYEVGADLFNAITHVLGYRLGDYLYYGLVNGVISKGELRNLFFDPFDDEGAALGTYLYLVTRTREVRIPERL